MSKPENVKCPECGGPMTSRANKSTGQRFWGCDDFPTCRGTRDTDGRSARERHEDRKRWVPDSSRWSTSGRDR